MDGRLQTSKIHWFPALTTGQRSYVVLSHRMEDSLKWGCMAENTTSTCTGFTDIFIRGT